MTDKRINITGAIFDFDGTLFDSMHVWKGYRCEMNKKNKVARVC